MRVYGRQLPTYYIIFTVQFDRFDASAVGTNVSEKFSLK